MHLNTLITPLATNGSYIYLHHRSASDSVAAVSNKTFYFSPKHLISAPNSLIPGPDSALVGPEIALCYFT